MYLGVDLGTSAVKALLMDAEGTAIASAQAPLTVSRPQPLWSEQNPKDWVAAAEAAVEQLPEDGRRAVRAVGLSGQMHGATLLNDADEPLRPAMLWNDGRAHRECLTLEAAEPSLRTITGNMALPGFTAPKLLWVRAHEPDCFNAVRKVLLPKDYLRLCWTGEHATDVADASGTLWLNVAERSWSEAALTASGLTPEQMPNLYESPEPAGELNAVIAERLGLPRVPVVAGAGDQAAGAIGIGAIEPGDRFVSLGTSGVLFHVGDGYHANPAAAVHSFCHALPATWHQMGVILSAASAVDTAARLAGFDSAAAGYAAATEHRHSDGVLFLPYLSGERTPHNDPHARGAFFGLTHDTTPAALVHAALEGVAFALADCAAALDDQAALQSAKPLTAIGGGARSAYWCELIAAVLGETVAMSGGADEGPALGAARLARLGVAPVSMAELCPPASDATLFEPDPLRSACLEESAARWRALYRSTAALGTPGEDS